LTLHLHRRIGQVTNKIDGYVTPDLFLQKKLAEGGISNTQFFKIMNPFDIAKYTPLYCPGKYFVFFGRIVREKGVFTLLAAMEKVPDLTLRVIGFGPSEGDAREMVRTRKIRNVEFCGPKYDSDLIEDLNHAIAVIVPTEWYDNSPLVIHQAFALGIPVIASDIDGIPEIVEDGQNGLLFKPGDAQQLADRMRYLVGDPDLRNRLGRNARKKAELEFTAEVRTKGMLAAMQAVIKGGRSD
jgi:glycosyltransferase involved in cell wall biosynthesis